MLLRFTDLYFSCNLSTLLSFSTCCAIVKSVLISYLTEDLKYISRNLSSKKVEFLDTLTLKEIYDAMTTVRVKLGLYYLFWLMIIYKIWHHVVFCLKGWGQRCVSSTYMKHESSSLSNMINSLCLVFYDPKKYIFKPKFIFFSHVDMLVNFLVRTLFQCFHYLLQIFDFMNVWWPSDESGPTSFALIVIKS